MLQLMNFSNYAARMSMIQHSAKQLEGLLRQLGLDGVEMLFCEPWDKTVVPPRLIHGVHLTFWPSWLDFWRGNTQALLKQFGTKNNIEKYYGGLDPEDMLSFYRENIRLAIAAQAEYMVFHVSHNDMDEMYTWQFRASDSDVIDATVELVNILSEIIPPDIEVLFENLWWPGMTLLDPAMVDKLLAGVRHGKTGIMLDTGHLMNTNHQLRSQKDGVKYILRILEQLGEYKTHIHGIHLHQSLSGEYVERTRSGGVPSGYSLEDAMRHALSIDQHRPFSEPEVRRLVEYVEPRYLVHEFLAESGNELVRSVRMQQQALGMLRADLS